MGGWAPKRFDVTLPAKLAKLAGFKVVTCRYLGPNQQAKVAQDVHARQAGIRSTAGEGWAEKMSKALNADADTVKAQREEGERLKREDPAEWALGEWPQEFVCLRAVKAFDGEEVEGVGDVEAWLDDGPHPSVTRAIAVGVLGESGLIPETEKAAGEGSGGSPAS